MLRFSRSIAPSNRPRKMPRPHSSKASAARGGTLKRIGSASPAFTTKPLRLFTAACRWRRAARGTGASA